MATSRKAGTARTKSARLGSKATRPARAAVSSKPKITSRTARAKPAPKKPVLKPVVAKAGAAKAVSKTAPKSVPAAKLAASKTGTKAKPGAKGKLSDAAARRAAQAEVRPLGVLPPESMVRSTRPAPPPVLRPRPAHPGPRTLPTPAQGAKKLTEHELKEFEARLLEERRKILKEMGHLEKTVLKVNQRDSSGDLSGYSFHMADAGTDAMEREKAFMFASTEGRTLMEINEALRRLYRGDYGVCESCGQPIAHGRLEAMPSARLCVACKEKEERAQRGAQ